MKKILVIGSGAREHAICQKFIESSSQNNQSVSVFALPGNAGIASIATIIDHIKLSDHGAIAQFCINNQIDFVFVGPEQPLVEGIVDDLEKYGIRVFGPSAAASRLEGSKSFMKNLAHKASIPTAQYQIFTEAKAAEEFAIKLGFPCVIKTDGLAAGKGVIIAQNHEEAKSTIKEIFAGKFGKAGNEIIIEEFLTGFEVSYFVICDSKNFAPLGFAHDYKKAGEGDTGLNTGGMGTYAPSQKISNALEEQIIKEIIEPTLQAMKDQDSDFKGILFAGLMITEGGPKLLEFNIRFGDPETQVLLPRIKSNFIELIEAAIDEKLEYFNIEFDQNKKSVCVVICANGYPEEYKKGIEINNLEIINEFSGAQILHAGTIFEDGKLVSNGGRVLNVVAHSDSFESARSKAYEVAEKINWQGGFYRKDIACTTS